MLWKQDSIYLLIIVTAIFFLDRISKTIVITNFSENKFVINNFINIDLTWNIGIGFGLLSYESSLIYNAITILIGIIILIVLYAAINSLYKDKLIFSIIAGGALGNFYDRLTYNAVPDFIDLHYNNFHWFTFNFADIFITIGIILLLIKDIFKKNV